MKAPLHVVMTTIREPTDSVLALHRRMAEYGGVLVVAGDHKGPAVFDLQETVFLGLQEQIEGPFKLARMLPTGHYARKNIGYLEAIHRGATCIYETDDDNAPLGSWAPRQGGGRRKTEVGSAALNHEDAKTQRQIGSADGIRVLSIRDDSIQSASPRWVNVYRYFTDDPDIWPRGLPLDQIGRPKTEDGRQQTLVGFVDLNHEDTKARRGEELRLLDAQSGLQSSVFSLQSSLLSPIQQGLVNGSPDVDAIWRLTQDRPFDFEDRPSVWLGPGLWCPFNTQSTWWWPVAYPLLYIPSYCSFRMCDIWKSFVAQRCLWAMGMGVTFHAPEVVQERNEHNLMKDFEDEVPGYLQNQRIAEILQGLELSAGTDAVGDNLHRCYEALIVEDIFPAKEMELVEAWLEDIAKMLTSRKS